jgi:hypothetical protein
MEWLENLKIDLSKRALLGKVKIHARWIQGALKKDPRKNPLIGSYLVILSFHLANKKYNKCSLTNRG